MPLVGEFGCLELVLYDISNIMILTSQSTVFGPMRVEQTDLD